MVHIVKQAQPENGITTCARLLSRGFVNRRYASSGREALEKVAASERALRRQNNWVGDQQRAREQRRLRANHLLEVYIVRQSGHSDQHITFAIQHKPQYCKSFPQRLVQVRQRRSDVLGAHPR